MKTTSRFLKCLTSGLLLIVVLFDLRSAETFKTGYSNEAFSWYSVNPVSFLNKDNAPCYKDKEPPVIEIGKANFDCYEYAYRPWSDFINISDNCDHYSLLKVSHTDSVDQNCTGEDIYIYRKWTVKDRAGNIATDIQELISNRVQITDVDFPGKVDWYCPTNRPALTLETGVPTYDGNPISHYCGIQVHYKDFTSTLCGTSVYIRRHWTITDCCTKYAINYDQDIYYHDTTKPIITCLAPLHYGTNVKECFTHQLIPPIQVFDSCNPQDISIYVKVDGYGHYQIGDKVILRKGNHIYEYFAKDACGNLSTCRVNVTVVDGQPPILSCSSVEVTLIDDTLCITPDQFVDEYWDDCNGISNVTLKIRILDDKCGDPNDDEVFKDCVTICCIGDDNAILVEIQATDQAGNSVTCITEVIVTSNKPINIKCQDTLKLNCGDIVPPTPPLIDFCGEYILQVKVVFDNRNASGIGTLIRRYIVTTTEGKKDSCETVIQVGLGPSNFGEDDLTCPNATVDLEGCVIPNLNSIPGIALKDTAGPCVMVNVALKLDTFTNLGTPCIRVRRTWTITDIKQPGLMLSCVQNININDTEKPILKGLKDTTINAGASCINALVDLPALQVMDCDPNVVVTNTFNNQGANIGPTIFPRGMTTIKFRAVDKCGNRDSLSIKVTVIDTSVFKVSCQSDTIVNCGVNFVPRAATIIASCTQLATNILSSDTIRNKCSITKINFKRIVTDTAGRKDSCTFMVTFRASDTLFCNQISWPKDTTFTTCGKSIHPDSIGLKPIFSHINSTCSRVTSTFKDTVLINIGNGSCTSITRRIWTVQDTCAIPPVVCRDTQLITVTDNTKPVLKVPKDTCVFLSQNSNGCDTLLSFLGNATAMDCDPGVSIKNVVIGKTDTAGASLVRRYNLGITNVLVIARDACGNTTRDTVVITVKDTVRPIAVCKKSNNYMNLNGVVQVNARVFNGGSTDNCSTPAQLRFSWTRKLSDTILEVNCNVLKIIRAMGDTILDSVRVLPFERNFNLWVTDMSGNQDTCEGNRFLAFFDTFNICNKAAVRTSALQGKVATLSGNNIPNVILSAIGQDQIQNKTDLNGTYALKGIKAGMYKLFAYKNDDPTLGVSTSDLVAIQKHIVGTKSFDKMGQFVAADINNDGDITIIDLLELRKLILGIYEEFPDNKSWRFFDQSLMARTQDHLALKEFENPFVEAVNDQTVTQNFTGIKIGDVNESGVPQIESLESRALSAVSLIGDDKLVEAGRLIAVPLYLDVTNLEGLQLTLKIRNGTVQGIAADGGSLITKGLYNENTLLNGELRMSWVNTVKLSGKQKLVTIYMNSTSAKRISELISITSGKIANEAYLKNGDVLALKLEMLASGEKSMQIEKPVLLQNAPNPFSQNTSIKFLLPADGRVSLSITDMSGKVVNQWSREYLKGQHQYIVSKQNLGSPGIYYYRMEYNGYVETKKLVLIE